MSREQNFIDVTLLGKEYRVACPPAEYAGLLEAVAYVNEKLDEVTEKTRSKMSERMAVMAALNIAHEFINLKKSIGDTATADPEKELDNASILRRIKNMESGLDAVLALQEPKT